MNKTNQTMDFEKKSYAKPLMEAYQVKSSSIICTSPKSTSNEEYEVKETTGWFEVVK